MTNKLRKILALMLCAAMLFGFVPVLGQISAKAGGEMFMYGELEFSIGTEIDGTYLTGCTGMLSGKVEIPAEVNGYTVTGVSLGAFDYCKNITEISFPATVKDIFNDNFYIYIPGLRRITVDPDNKYYSSDEYGVLFNKSKTELILFPILCEQTDYIIPDTVHTISDGAFYGSDIQNVTIPESVIEISVFAFNRCEDLAEINIPASVEHIVPDFADCVSRINVDENNVYYSNDEYGVLFDKDKTELLRYPCNSTAKEYTIPDTVTGLSMSSFNDCNYLESVTIPGSVYRIEMDAFLFCYALKEVNICEGVAYIEAEAFEACYNLTEVNLPDSLYNIGKWAFADCYQLKEITLPENVHYIDYGAFNNSGLESIGIPASIINIDNYAFQDCDSLTDVYYGGTKADKLKIEIGKYNTELISAVWHCADGDESPLVRALKLFIIRLTEFFNNLEYTFRIFYYRLQDIFRR